MQNPQTEIIGIKYNLKPDPKNDCSGCHFHNPNFKYKCNAPNDVFDICYINEKQSYILVKIGWIEKLVNKISEYIKGAIVALQDEGVDECICGENYEKGYFKRGGKCHKCGLQIWENEQ